MTITSVIVPKALGGCKTGSHQKNDKIKCVPFGKMIIGKPTDGMGMDETKMSFSSTFH